MPRAPLPGSERELQPAPADPGGHAHDHERHRQRRAENNQAELVHRLGIALGLALVPGGGLVSEIGDAGDDRVESNDLRRVDDFSAFVGQVDGGRLDAFESLQSKGATARSPRRGRAP